MGKCDAGKEGAGAEDLCRGVGASAAAGPHVGRHASFWRANPLVYFVPYAFKGPAEITVFIQPVIYFFFLSHFNWKRILYVVEI